MTQIMRNLTNPVASANRVAARPVSDAYASCAALVTETATAWMHTPVTGFGKKRQRPKDLLL